MLQHSLPLDRATRKRNIPELAAGTFVAIGSRIGPAAAV
jgi:hypothetical protein